MGTRSRIAIGNADGSFTSIYCHWDGYPSHSGKTLRDHYSDPKKVAELVALGDLSSLGAEIGVKHSADTRNKKHQDWCFAYRRDREETDVDQERSDNFEQLLKLTQETGGEYLYVFKDGSWFCAKGGVAFFGAPADKAPEFLEPIDEVLNRGSKD